MDRFNFQSLNVTLKWISSDNTYAVEQYCSSAEQEPSLVEASLKNNVVM